jgi:hypothetical protein
MRRRREPPEYEELLASVRDLPPGKRGHILGGRVCIDPAPSPARAHTLAEVSAMLVAGSPLSGSLPKGWSFLSNVELAFGPTGLVVADIAGWQLDRRQLASLVPPIRVPPAWVCEVMDGGTRRLVLSEKRRAYAEIGVRHLWIAETDAEVLDVYVNTGGRWVLLDSISERMSIEAAPFEGLKFDADDLWSSVPSSAIPPGPSSKRRNGA